MGLLDDLLYNASPDNGSGLLGYLNNGRTAHVSDDAKSTSANDLAAALGLNDIGSTSQNTDPNNPGMTNAPAAAPAPGAPGAPSVPISPPGLLGTPPAAPAPASMTSPVAAPQFGANASPYLFPQSSALFGGNLPAPAAPVVPPTVANANASADDDDTPTTPAAPAQAAPIAVGNYQMPRIGPAASFTPAPAAPAPAPAATPGNPLAQAIQPVQSFLNRAADGLQSVSRGGSLTGAIRGQYDDPTSKAAQIANVTARALIARGVDPQVVAAAVQPGNGEMLKSLMPVLSPSAYTQETDKDGNVWNVNKQTGQKTVALQQKDEKFSNVTIKNADGSESVRTLNNKTGEYGAPIGATNNGGGEILGDASKTGQEYVNTIPADKRDTVKGMLDGTIQPPTSFAAAKPYWQQMITAAKHADPTWDENNWAARHKMSIDLASSGNSTMGGILSNGESSFKHLAEYAQSAADQGNTSHNFLFGGALAHAQNYIGNKTGGSDTAGAIKAINDNLGHYGQESTKFYAGTGGGVEERMNALHEMDPTTTSGEEAAAYAQKEKGLMLDRLNTKFQEIRNTYGDEQASRIIAKHMPDIQKNIATIDANIARLRGEAASQSAAPAAPATPKLKVGQSTVINGVPIKKVAD